MTSWTTLQTERSSLQQTLDGAKTLRERNQLGQYSTPEPLAASIVGQLLDYAKVASSLRVLDPAMGTGVFPLAVLAEAERRGYSVDTICGYDIDEHYAVPSMSLLQEAPISYRIADFTVLGAPASEAERFDLLACNPPYVRHHHLDALQKERLARQVQSLTGYRPSRLAGLHVAFTILGTQWLRSGGVGAWLVPSEFLDVNYGVVLKRFLLERVTLLRIHRFDAADEQFADALVSSCVVFLRNERPSADHHVDLTFGGSVSKPIRTVSLRAGSLDPASKWSRLGTGAADRPSTEPVLGDLFTIKRGIVTGCNDFFVLDESRARARGLPADVLTPLLPGPRHLPNDVVEADSDGDPILDTKRFLFDCRLTGAQLLDAPLCLRSYLSEGQLLGADKGYIAKHRPYWWLQETRPPAPLLCTYMGRSQTSEHSPFRFVLNKSRAIAANVYLMLYPRPEARLAEPDIALFVERVWQFLKDLPSETLTSNGREYGGGLFKLEPAELAMVPLGAAIATKAKMSLRPVQRYLFGHASFAK